MFLFATGQTLSDIEKGNARSGICYASIERKAAPKQGKSGKSFIGGPGEWIPQPIRKSNILSPRKFLLVNFFRRMAALCGTGH
jgi:hypothetical protein